MDGTHGGRRGDRAEGLSVRDRLVREGAARLRDEELVALLASRDLRSAPGAVARAAAWIGAAGGLAPFAARLREGCAGRRDRGLPGSLSARARLLAALEIGSRASPAAVPLAPLVRCPEDAARETRALAAERREHLVGLYLDAQSRLLAVETVAVGSLNVARALPRDLLEPALRHGATGFVVVHNHPSGIPEPSEDDVRFTQTVGRGAALLGVALLDHVVVARGGFASLRARGVRWEGLEPPGG